jgi:hypothetical protein
MLPTCGCKHPCQHPAARAPLVAHIPQAPGLCRHCQHLAARATPVAQTPPHLMLLTFPTAGLGIPSDPGSPGHPCALAPAGFFGILGSPRAPPCDARRVNNINSQYCNAQPASQHPGQSSGPCDAVHARSAMTTTTTTPTRKLLVTETTRCTAIHNCLWHNCNTGSSCGAWSAPPLPPVWLNDAVLLR